MKLLIIDNTDPKDAWFNKPLVDMVAGQVDCDVVNYTKTPADITAYGGVILNGVLVDYSFESINERRANAGWLYDSTVPVLGICLGHQIIGTLFGADIIEDAEAEDGLVMIKKLRDDPIMQGLSAEFEATAMHRGSITVPKDFVLLASSAVCQNQIMKHRERALYGVQFHPELSPTGLTIFKNFINLAAERYNNQHAHKKTETMHTS